MEGQPQPPAGTMPLPGMEDAGRPEWPPWPAWIGLVGVLVAIVATGLLVAIVVSAYAAVGVDDPDDSSSIDFALIAAQSVGFVAAALMMTTMVVSRPTLRQFGFRRFDSSALGWALLALFAYFVLSAIYVAIASPPQDDLPQELGADESTALAVVTGVFVIAIAPPVEEFFFRGFLYQALRNGIARLAAKLLERGAVNRGGRLGRSGRVGVIGGALASGLIFGLIHLKLPFLVPLFILGTALALLFEKTNSIWPCIFVHALNNALAFSVTV